MHDGYLFLQGKQFGDSLYVGVHSDGKYITISLYVGVYSNF